MGILTISIFRSFSFAAAGRAPPCVNISQEIRAPALGWLTVKQKNEIKGNFIAVVRLARLQMYQLLVVVVDFFLPSL